MKQLLLLSLIMVPVFASQELQLDESNRSVREHEFDKLVRTLKQPDTTTIGGSTWNYRVGCGLATIGAGVLYLKYSDDINHFVSSKALAGAKFALRYIPGCISKHFTLKDAVAGYIFCRGGKVLYKGLNTESIMLADKKNGAIKKLFENHKVQTCYAPRTLCSRVLGVLAPQSN